MRDIGMTLRDASAVTWKKLEPVVERVVDPHVESSRRRVSATGGRRSVRNAPRSIVAGALSAFARMNVEGRKVQSSDDGLLEQTARPLKKYAEAEGDHDAKCAEAREFQQGSRRKRSVTRLVKAGVQVDVQFDQRIVSDIQGKRKFREPSATFGDTAHDRCADTGLRHRLIKKCHQQKRECGS
jgi:hypothetical protein